MINVFFLHSALVEVAENEFNLMVEEEIQRRIKEQETHDQQDKMRTKLKKHDDADATGPESETDDQQRSQEVAHENGTSNGHLHVNESAQNINGNTGKKENSTEI